MKRSFGVLTLLAGVAGVWACGGQIDGGGGSGVVEAGSPGDCSIPVPAPIQPLNPQHGIAEICSGVGGTPAPSDTVAALKATVVGRWIACAGGQAGTTGIELDGNGRYQYLV